MEEKRIAEQNQVRDKDGHLLYTTINAYKRKNNFISGNEYIILDKLEQIYKENKDIKIFMQVAVNSIVDFNEQRNTKELNYAISQKSIDFVIYNSNREIKRILYCIELNGEEHEENEERKKRDEFIKEIFSMINIKLIWIKNGIKTKKDVEDILKKEEVLK